MKLFDYHMQDFLWISLWSDRLELIKLDLWIRVAAAAEASESRLSSAAVTLVSPSIGLRCGWFP